MKKAILTLLMLAAAGASRAQQAGQLGAGVVLGQPIGGTAKYWLTDTRAFDAGVGYGSRATVLYADYLYHGWDLLPKPSKGKLGVYAGLGPRLETARDALFALRTIVGADYWIEAHPIELFLEGGPTFRLAPNSNVDADIGLGIRFYLGSATKAKT